MFYIYHLNKIDEETGDFTKVKVEHISNYDDGPDNLDEWYEFLDKQTSVDIRKVFKTKKSLLYISTNGIICLAIES